jgi:uncharacterized membrane protein
MNPAALLRRERLYATVPLPRKENVRMKRSLLIGGILLLVAAALVFVGLDTSSSVPIASGLAVVGIALVAISRRRSQ